jgi:hypothetical protein
MAELISQSALLKRSLAASKTSNEHSRTAGQSYILINGGAATAVIAYLSKDKLDASMIPQAALSLAGYGAGVFFAALVMFFATQSMEQWSLYWLARAEGKVTDNHQCKGHAWWYAYYAASLMAMVCFVGASVWFALALSRHVPAAM